MNRGDVNQMVRLIIVSVFGTYFLAQTAFAADNPADRGRYQVIPDALVPGKGGKIQERTIMLDSATGRTWLIAPGAKSGKSNRPIWIPIEVEMPKRTNAAAWSEYDPETATIPKSNANPSPRRETLPFAREYDDDP